MLDMLICAEYKCKIVKTQIHNQHLMQEQNICTYAMLKSQEHNIIC